MFAQVVSLALVGASPAMSESAGVSSPAASSPGFHVDGPVVGPVQAFSKKGSGTGLSLGLAIQVDVGPRLAARVPLDIVIKSGTTAYREVSLAPGLRYRWRSSPEQFLVPFAGLGMRLGLANPEDTVFTGEPPVPPEFEGPAPRFLASPEVSAGVELRPVRWFALTLQADYTFVWMNVPTVLHVVRERAGLRFSF
jgi:hypothetical protein